MLIVPFAVPDSHHVMINSKQQLFIFSESQFTPGIIGRFSGPLLHVSLAVSDHSSSRNQKWYVGSKSRIVVDVVGSLVSIMRFQYKCQLFTFGSSRILKSGHVRSVVKYSIGPQIALMVPSSSRVSFIFEHGALEFS